MADYKDILTAALNEGKTMEDVMKKLATALNEVQAERTAVAKYDNYTKPLDIEESVYAHRIGTAEKLSAADTAKFLAHFLCQNVPGYAVYCAKTDKDLIKSTASQLNNLVYVAELEVKTNNKSDEEKAEIMLSGLVNRVANSIMEAAAKDNVKADIKSQKTSAGRSETPAAMISDVERITDFFRKYGL